MEQLAWLNCSRVTAACPGRATSTALAGSSSVRIQAPLPAAAADRRNWSQVSPCAGRLPSDRGPNADRPFDAATSTARRCRRCPWMMSSTWCPRGGRDGHAAAHLDPVALRPGSAGIEPVDCIAGGRFGVAFVALSWVLGRTSVFRAALVAMSLQELAHQLLAPPVQFPFEFALAHLPGFAGREEGFGIREDSIGRRRGSPRWIDARDAGPRPWNPVVTAGLPPASHGTVPERRANSARLSGRRPKGSAGCRKEYALACLMSLPKWPWGDASAGKRAQE